MLRRWGRAREPACQAGEAAAVCRRLVFRARRVPACTHRSRRRAAPQRFRGPFAVMIRAADRWCRVSISDLERHQLTLLRAELGLDPPPASTRDRKSDRRKNIAA